MGRHRLPPVARDWLGQGSVVKWKGRVHAGTFVGYYGFLYPFCIEIGKTPDELLEWAKASKDRYDVLDAVQAYVGGLSALRFGSMKVGYAALRSFFEHNRAALPIDRSFHIRSDVAPVERQLTIDNLKELVGLAVQPWRSMILVKWSGLLDTEGLMYVSRKHADVIVEAARKGEKLLKLSVPGRKGAKNQRPFYTFIGAVALEAIRQYLERERGEVKPGEPLWLYPHAKRPVTKHGFSVAWMRLLRRAKLVDEYGDTPGSRYGYNVHNTRDLAISLLNTVPGLNPKCIEFWAGHDIDPLGYNQFYSIKPDYVKEQYQLAEPHLDLFNKKAAAEVDIWEMLKKKATEDPDGFMSLVQVMKGFEIERPLVK